MDIVDKVLSVAQAIHAQFEQVKCCKHQCQRLVERIQILLKPVMILKAQPPKHISCHEEELLKKLLWVLREAQKLVMKYSQTSWIQKFLRAHSASEEFVWVNESLEDIAQGLSLLLQAEQKQVFLEAFQAKTCRKQDAEDLRDDRAFLDQVIASKCAFSKPSFPETGSWHLSQLLPSFRLMAVAKESQRDIQTSRKTNCFSPTCSSSGPTSAHFSPQVPRSLKTWPGRSTLTDNVWRAR